MWGLFLGLLGLAGCAGQQEHLLSPAAAGPVFHLFQWQPTTQQWDVGKAISAEQGEQFFQIAKAAKRWDGQSHAAGSGQRHSFAPAPTIRVKKWTKPDHQMPEVVDVCQGNWLLSYHGSTYQVAGEAHDLLARWFPANN